MAITVNVYDNPHFNTVGDPKSDTVYILTSVAATRYEIQRQDGQESFIVNVSDGISGKVLSINSQSLKIVLPMRQKYKVRVFTGTWSAFVNFKTRDKNYSSPSAITSLETDADVDTVLKTSKTITVTNLAKQTVTNTSRGATVVNSKKVLNSVASIADTARGATIIGYSDIVPLTAINNGNALHITFSGLLQNNSSMEETGWSGCTAGVMLNEASITTVVVNGSVVNITYGEGSVCSDHQVSYNGTTLRSIDGSMIKAFTNFPIT